MSKIAKVIASPFGALVGAFKRPKAPAAPTVLPRSRFAAGSALADAITQRRGTLANNRTGPSGLESSAGKKTQLGM